MNISVQRWERTKETNDNWAIVIDGEHILFVGKYVACEDWLDRHEELCRQHGENHQISRRVRFEKIVQKSVACLTIAFKQCATFLVREDGFIKVTEFLLMAAVVSALYAGGLISIWTVWKANGHCNFYPLKAVIEGPIVGRPEHDWRHGLPDESIDIVCDWQP